MQHALLFSLLLVATSCGSDNGIIGLCSIPARGFNIEEVSILQDTQGSPLMHDGVILTFDTSTLPDGARWRVKSVEVLPMLGATGFDWAEDGQLISVEVFDSADPTQGAPWTVRQPFFKGDHTWEDVSLSNPYSSWETDQKQAWWSFDFSEVIPTSGMSGGDYLVALSWDSAGSPTFGYSNFDLDCSKNWTDYATGEGWVLNEAQAGPDAGHCSWPMLKVNIEILTDSTVCDDGQIINTL